MQANGDSQETSLELAANPPPRVARLNVWLPLIGIIVGVFMAIFGRAIYDRYFAPAPIESTTIGESTSVFEIQTSADFEILRGTTYSYAVLNNVGGEPQTVVEIRGITSEAPEQHVLLPDWAAAEQLEFWTTSSCNSGAFKVTRNEPRPFIFASSVIAVDAPFEAGSFSNDHQAPQLFGFFVRFNTGDISYIEFGHEDSATVAFSDEAGEFQKACTPPLGGCFLGNDRHPGCGPAGTSEVPSPTGD